jgi:hypothetical protein
VFGAAVIALVATACGAGNGDPGPTAHPDKVIADAPDLTIATGAARVVTGAPGIEASGTVVFATGDDALIVKGRATNQPPFGVTQPVAVVDLLRGVVKVRAYGGAEVQGEGTKRYEVDIDLAKAIAATPAERRADLHLLDGLLGKDAQLWADVFVDGKGRVRRVLLPVHTEMDRPYGADKHIPQLVSVDYSNFGSPR